MRGCGCVGEVRGVLGRGGVGKGWMRWPMNKWERESSTCSMDSMLYMTYELVNDNALPFVPYPLLDAKM